MKSRLVKRLPLLVGAIVIVDTMFYAALTPLLPHYALELGLSKASAGVLAGAYAFGALAGGIPSAMLAMNGRNYAVRKPAGRGRGDPESLLAA
jgi:predicted MFS family arabinose efflux permease